MDASARRPLIGVTTSEVRVARPVMREQHYADSERPEMALGMTYLRAFERCGALALVVPPAGGEVVESLLDRVDGICLSGGPDVDPSHYRAAAGPALGPTWARLDALELELVRGADARGLPVLGICRGSQVLNVARGGTLYQHLPDLPGVGRDHRQREPGEATSHKIELEPGTKLRELIGRERIEVNSLHHQAVDRLGEGLVASAFSADRVIEAIEDPGEPFLVGVQWHAEFLVERESEHRLFSAFIAAAREYRRRASTSRRAGASAKPRHDWAEWKAGVPFAIGIEEEVMLVDPQGFGLARLHRLRGGLSDGLNEEIEAETNAASVEHASSPQRIVADAVAELAGLREQLAAEMEALGVATVAAATHPFANWEESEVSPGKRYRYVHETMRELARREPTHAMHVHVGVPEPERAIELLGRLRAHLPLLLALAASSPFWQGRDSGLASARTPIFDTFPRSGMPRLFHDYHDYVESIALLIEAGAIPDPSFVWWDIRLQPRFGTIEIRIMDVQAESWRTAALAALCQSLVRLEAVDGYAPPRLVGAREVLLENRFLAYRDGVEAKLIDPISSSAIPVRELTARLLAACEDHAGELGCSSELADVERILDQPADRMLRELAGPEEDYAAMLSGLRDRFTAPREAAHPRR